MKFENPKVPDGINVSPQHPLRDFLVLAGALLAGIAALGILLYLVGGTIARNMPFAWEQALADQVIPAAHDHPDVVAALQAITDELAREMNLPEGMTIRVHYAPDDTFNAFATLGGHIFVYRGLLERMPSENALAMVLAHEIAHVRHRDPAEALGGSLLLQFGLALIAGHSDSLLDSPLYGGGTIVVRGHSREAERLADQAAVEALVAHYGHAGGAITLFREMYDVLLSQGEREPPAFLSTHPLTLDRMAAIEDWIADQGLPREGPQTDLPPVLAALRR